MAMMPPPIRQLMLIMPLFADGFDTPCRQLTMPLRYLLYAIFHAACHAMSVIAAMLRLRLAL